MLRGSATLTTSGAIQRLDATQQAIVAPDGTFGAVTHRSARATAKWFVHAGTRRLGRGDSRAANARGRASGSVELAPDTINGTQVTAIEFLRGGDQHDITETGVRQTVGKTLRVYSSLLLQFDAKITDQRPLGGGDDQATFPLMIKLIYVDIQGHEQEWSHGYYVYADPDHKTPADRGTRESKQIAGNTLVFDLR